MSFIECIILLVVSGLVGFALIDRICSAIEKCSMYSWYSTVGWPDGIDCGDGSDCKCGDKKDVTEINS